MTKHSHFPNDRRFHHKVSFPLLLIVLLLAGFTVSAQAKSTSDITTRIIGGTDTDPNDYPWTTALLFANISNGFNAQFCGGTLIASRWVLTAAHCVNDFSSPNEIEVAIGINDLNNINNADRKTVVNIFMHPNYDTNSQDSDIALLELATPSNSTVLAIADNSLTDNIATGELMTIIGWGATAPPPQAPSYPNLLQETQIPQFDFDACNTIYNSDLTNNMICAGFDTGEKDTCQGDSGGPILYFNTSDDTYYQTGITSFGNGCAEADNPGVYTRAANYLDWINDTKSTPLAGQRQFGYHGINRSTSTTLTLHNYFGADITVSAVNFSNPTNFTLLSQNCTGTTIVDNDSCSITLQFQATNAGTHQATLSIDFGTANPSVNATISGTTLAAVNAAGLDESPARLWYSGDNANWFNVPVGNSTGGTAMRSGNIGDNQKTALLSYFTGPDTLDFRWKASTEQDFDFLKLYINDVLIDSISGNQDWQQYNATLDAGENRVVWVYEKDTSANELQDTVWLDSVNTPFDNTPDDELSGGGGKFSELFLLLIAIVLILRKGLHHRALLLSSKQHIAGI